MTVWIRIGKAESNERSGDGSSSGEFVNQAHSEVFVKRSVMSMNRAAEMQALYIR